MGTEYRIEPAPVITQYLNTEDTNAPGMPRRFSYAMKDLVPLTVRGPIGRVGGRVLALVEMGRGSALVHALIRPHCMEEITAMEILRNLRYVI